ncbi:B12-binding domain-containing radical SAM protein [Nanoarchaeota archaeon]
MKKIQLIFPEGGSNLSSSGILPPVGIISLATYLKSKRPDLEIQLFDGEITPQREIIEGLNGGLVGISITGANYHNALEIAKEAKRKGARVIVGGSHATVKHKQILHNQRDIDAVVRGNGETVLYEFLKANKTENYRSLEGVKNLSYKDVDGSIKVNPISKKCEEVDLNLIPSPDYSLLEDLLEQYSQNFQKHVYRKEGYTRFVSLESQKGCAKTKRKSEKKGRCSFCARIDKGLRRLNPQEFWKRVRQICDPDGKTMIWDVSDSFSGTVSEQDDWLKQVVESKPLDLEGKVGFKIFGRADEIDEKSVRYLKKIGICEVFIGIESGDQRKLDAINKGSTVEDNLKAVEILGNYDITTYVSLVYALPDENSESLERTYQHTKELIERGKIAGIGARVLFPLAGSIDHERLLRKLRENGEKELAEEIRNTDYYDAGDLQRLWIRHMTNTNMDEIKKYHKKIMELAESYVIQINDEQRLCLS